MEQNIVVFLQLVLVAYFMSVGFGMIVGQGRGVAWVNRQWRSVVAWCIRTPINLLGELLRAIARRIR